MDRMSRIKAAAKKKPKKNENAMNSATVRFLTGQEDCICFKYTGDIGGYKGHSDIYGIYRGRPFYLEGKVGKNKPTVAQQQFLRDVAVQGAITGVYHSKEEAWKILREAMGEPVVYGEEGYQ